MEEEAKFIFIINYINGGYVLIAKSLNSNGDTISDSTLSGLTYDQVVIKQNEFYETNKIIIIDGI